MSDAAISNPKHWIQTYTGRAFFPLDPRATDIVIEDIAHALAHQCRYTGHTSRFYSVAEHSIYVSRQVPPKDRLAGLLHDASEAYLCDIASPVKRQPEFAAYRAAENKLQAAILKRFDLAPDLPDSVKTADLRMLATEAPVLMAPLHPGWTFPAPAFEGLKIECMAPSEARAAFLACFYFLTRGT